MKHAAILCLGAIAAPAAADVGAPRSLQMRAPRRPSPIVVGQAAAPPPADDAPPAAGENGKTEIISVIDSPIEHELLTGRVPATVVTRADLAASGHATLGDILQSLPSQSNGGNSQVNAGGDGTTRINLRGLGVARTLVLLNGRRMVNGGRGADAAVDLNAIPLAAIERVEVLKDGASAIYGADAVGGVVNLVTRPKFDGADVSLLTSTSQHGDGSEYDASFVTGFTTRDKRTYLVVSGGAQRHEAVFAGDRSFSTFPRTFDFAARRELANGSSAAPGGRLDASSIGSGGFHIAGCPSDV
ncbi:MAG: TonB-dependent receptor plug domain-containing protein, partial [Solirubrobacteraceae bacterium]